MDLKVYYRKLRQIEQEMPEEFVVVKSLATPDGGISGRLTEVARFLAAKMAADGLAVLAEKAEAALFRERVAEEQKQEEQKRASAKVQFTMLTESDLRALQQQGRGGSKE
ncbi:MAG: hypothetical protein HY238_04375 [Acidobacteria bacterium]|nr:hypothetical protein [Acidobacteriota bacterium]